jgi:hypothetical protein
MQTLRSDHEYAERFNAMLATGWDAIEPDDLFHRVEHLIEDMASHLGQGPERDAVLTRRAMIHAQAGRADAMMVADHMAFLSGVLNRPSCH